MKSMLPLLLLLSLTTALAGSNPGPCGPPLFKCSRTDNAMVDTPLPPPAKVGTGFSGSTARATRDITLQSGRIVRCTDGDFLASSGTLNGITFQAGAGGSAEARMWSIDHVLINVADSQAGYTPSTFRGFGVTGLAGVFTKTTLPTPAPAACAWEAHNSAPLTRVGITRESASFQRNCRSLI